MLRSTRGRSAAVLLLAMGPLLMAGCAASIHTGVRPTVLPQQTSRVTALGVMPETIEFGSEWLKPEAMEQLVATLSERYPEIEILGPDETARRLVEHSLADEYASLLDAFHRAGVVDPARVATVLDALGVSHFLNIRAGYASQEFQEATTNFDGSPLIYSASNQDLRVVARLWGATDHAPSWEAVATSGSRSGFLSRKRAREDLLVSLVLSLVESIPVDPASGIEGPTSLKL